MAFNLIENEFKNNEFTKAFYKKKMQEKCW